MTNQPSGEQQSPQTPPITINNVLPSNRTNGCLKLGAGCVVVVILLLVLPPMLGINTLNSFLGRVRDLFIPDPKLATVTDTQSILSGIQTNSQFVSLTVQLAKANISVGVEQRGLLDNNLCGYSGTYVAQGTIRAGIDLTQIKEADISFDEANQTYHIKLPAAQLMSCSVDYIDQYAGTTTLCPGIDWDENRQLASFWAKTEFINDSIDGQILSRAEGQAELGIGNFIKSITGKNVEIDFSESVNTIDDSTCQAEPPEGWVQNAETGTWSKP